MLRVMVPGGRGAVAVWDAIENAPAFATLAELLDKVAGKLAGDALRAPFVLGDRQALAALFKDAGADPINITSRGGAARFPDMREFVEAELRGWLPVMGVVLPEPQIDRLLAEAERGLARHVTRDGLSFAISAHLATWRRP
jgi:hypothetical protein